MSAQVVPRFNEKKSKKPRKGNAGLFFRGEAWVGNLRFKR